VWQWITRCFRCCWVERAQVARAPGGCRWLRVIASPRWARLRGVIQLWSKTLFALNLADAVRHATRLGQQRQFATFGCGRCAAILAEFGISIDEFVELPFQGRPVNRPDDLHERLWVEGCRPTPAHISTTQRQSDR
jgi:hypothetical protein